MKKRRYFFHLDSKFKDMYFCLFIDGLDIGYSFFTCIIFFDLIKAE
ncbi:hypothetical protein DSUL_20512 [Desulfovibrionales bacterium]